MPYYNILREKYPHEMFLMKNHMDKMIIAYAIDERNSTKHCQNIYQKGFDNIYMLSGGLEDFVRDYPDFCEGKEMSKIIHEQEKKAEIEREQLNKNRYKTNSMISGKNNINGSMKSGVNEITSGVKNMNMVNNNMISSKVSTVSEKISVNTGVDIHQLKNDLKVKK